MNQVTSFPINLVLPWESTAQEDRRIYAALISAIAVAILLAIIIPLITVPELKREQAEKIPPRLAKLIIEKKKVEIPKKPPEIPIPELPKETPKPEKVPPKEKEKPKDQPKAKVEKAQSAKAVAKKQAMVFDSLADIREVETINKVTQTNTLARSGDTQQAKTTRDILTSKTATTSGGVQTSKASRNSAGGYALGTSNVEEVSSGISASAARQQANASSKGKNVSQRSSESINRIFDRNKSAIYQVYHRALRDNPLLRGRVVFHLTITPDGTVSKIRIVSSELNDTALEKKLKFKIKRINFGAENVGTWANTYHIDFLPG